MRATTLGLEMVCCQPMGKLVSSIRLGHQGAIDKPMARHLPHGLQNQGRLNPPGSQALHHALAHGG